MSDAAVFISHAEEDRATAMAVCDALEAANIRCWIAPRDIPPGENYLMGISHGLDLARLVVVIMSEHANAWSGCFEKLRARPSATSPSFLFGCIKRYQARR